MDSTPPARFSQYSAIEVAPGETFEVESSQFGLALRNRLAVVDTGFAKVKAL